MLFTETKRGNSYMRNWIILLLIFTFFACGQKVEKSGNTNEPFTENGVVKQYDESNRLSSEITFKNGVRHGVTKIYYSSGALSDEIMYVDDMKNGMAKKFHKNGQLYSLTPYHDDEKHGIQKKYYSNGDRWAETPYMKGQAGIGLKEYRRDGSLRTNFPVIEVQKLVKDDRVILKLFLSNYSKNVIFYISELMGDKYIPIAAQPLESKSGSARYEFTYPKGAPFNSTISIISKYRTKDYNINVTLREYKISIN